MCRVSIEAELRCSDPDKLQLPTMQACETIVVNDILPGFAKKILVEVVLR